LGDSIGGEWCVSRKLGLVSWKAKLMEQALEMGFRMMQMHRRSMGTLNFISLSNMLATISIQKYD